MIGNTDLEEEKIKTICLHTWFLQLEFLCMWIYIYTYTHKYKYIEENLGKGVHQIIISSVSNLILL